MSRRRADRDSPAEPTLTPVSKLRCGALFAPASGGAAVGEHDRYVAEPSRDGRLGPEPGEQRHGGGAHLGGPRPEWLHDAAAVHA
jgi:hypothetical protein